MARYGNNHRGGRPTSRSTLASQKMREELVRAVKKEMKPILRGQLDLAKGIVVEKIVHLVDGKTEARYYKQTPNISSATYLLDQAIGRPLQTLETPDLGQSLTALVSGLEKDDKDKK